MRAQAWAWRSPRKLWSVTEAVFGLNLSSVQAQRYISPFQTAKFRMKVRLNHRDETHRNPDSRRQSGGRAHDAGSAQSGRILNQLSVVEDGEQAMDFLLRSGQYPQAPRPDLILLDLNLPKKDGREILAEIKNNPDLRSIPVVVLTTSQAEEDVMRSYNCGANCFIVKPVDLEQFTSTILSLEDFWFSIVKLPAK